MKRVLLDVSGFQSADDGNTSYWGGCFTLDGVEYNFSGTDREHEPCLCIFDVINVEFAEHYDLELGNEVLYTALESIGVEGEPTKFLISLGGDRVSIDPV